MKDNKIKKRIMRRVYVIYLARKVFSPLALKVYVLSVSLGGTVSLVSVGNVLANMPNDLASALNFMFYALTHTEFVVQFLVFGTLAVSLWLVRDVVRDAQHVTHVG